MADKYKLAATVHVDGTIYEAGKSVPREVAEKITNPKAWGGKAPDFGDGGSSDPTEPPREGRGSGDQAWQEYAKAISLDVPADAKKADIIAKLDEVRAAAASSDGNAPKE